MEARIEVVLTPDSAANLAQVHRLDTRAASRRDGVCGPKICQAQQAPGLLARPQRRPPAADPPNPLRLLKQGASGLADPVFVAALGLGRTLLRCQRARM